MVNFFFLPLVSINTPFQVKKNSDFTYLKRQKFFLNEMMLFLAIFGKLFLLGSVKMGSEKALVVGVRSDCKFSIVRLE